MEYIGNIKHSSIDFLVAKASAIISSKAVKSAVTVDKGNRVIVGPTYKARHAETVGVYAHCDDLKDKLTEDLIFERKARK